MFNDLKISSVEHAITCNDLWNIENGRTLCIKCHNKTKGNRKRKKNDNQQTNN